MKLYFVTENRPKFHNAQIILDQFKIQLVQKELPLIEIQSNSLEEIAKHKAEQAYKEFKKPLVVKDDGWYITALNGFPGSYMKYMNEWLAPSDFLHLIQPYPNKEIIFKDALCYIDKNQNQIFTNTIKGCILDKPKGKGVSIATLATFRKDNKTMAQCINEGIHFAQDNNSIWIEFANWYKNLR